MKKKIGITCDYWKIEKFRKRILEKEFVIEFDGESGITNVWLFRIECDEKDFANISDKIRIMLQQLDIELKQSN